MIFNCRPGGFFICREWKILSRAICKLGFPADGLFVPQRPLAAVALIPLPFAFQTMYPASLPQPDLEPIGIYPDFPPRIRLVEAHLETTRIERLFNGNLYHSSLRRLPAQWTLSSWRHEDRQKATSASLVSVVSRRLNRYSDVGTRPSQLPY